MSIINALFAGIHFGGIVVAVATLYSRDKETGTVTSGTFLFEQVELFKAYTEHPFINEFWGQEYPVECLYDD